MVRVKRIETPCPWCGGESRVIIEPSVGTPMLQAQVECFDCCATSPVYFNKNSFVAGEKAIKHWRHMFNEARRKTNATD